MKKDIPSKIDELNSRRLFLKGLACGTTLAMAGTPGIALASKKWLQPAKNLAFHNLHTEEKVSVTYFEQGHYVPDAEQELNYLLRDHRSGDVHGIDRELFDLLHDLQLSLGGNKTFQVISGYRSPKTNAMLSKKSSGVAKKSFHMQGKAIDIRVVGVDSKIVQQAAIAMKRGGVGYYQSSNFIHIDTGHVRHW